MNKKIEFSNVNLISEELEPRLLLSADGLAVLTEANIATSQELVLGDNEINALVVQNHTEQSSLVIQTSLHSTELVIIDSRVPNFQQLHNDVIRAQQQGRDINVLILDAHRDGLEQISEALSKYNNLDAVHIVSHGKNSQLQLGATQLNKQNLQQRSDEIKQWQQVFTDGGDLLLYGCNLAQNEQGKQFVDELSKLTGADIAASDDTTGHELLGADWNFEYTTSDIETQLAFSDSMQQQWQGSLLSATDRDAAELYIEDTALNLTDIVVNGSVGGNVTVTLTLSDDAAGSLNAATSGSVTSTFSTGVWTASGTEDDVNILLAGLTFTPSLNYNSDFSIASIVDDGLSPPLTGTKYFTGTAVNDAPVIDLDADDSSTSTGADFQTTFIEQAGAVNITDGDVSLIDVDSANLTSIIVTLTNSPQPSSFESLAADISETGLTAVWDEINDILTISGPGTVADYLLVLSTVTYDNTENNPSSNDRIIEFVANDGTDTSVIATTTVSIEQIKKAPVANDDDFTVDEGSTNILILAVNDTDKNGDLDYSSIEIVSGPTYGTITAINTDGSVEYVHDGSETLSDSFTYTIKDLIGAMSDTATVTLTINPINDAPTATNLSAPENYTEDTTLNLTEIVVSDVDSADVTVTLTLSDLGAGLLSTGTSNAVTSSFVTGVWTARGTIADVNTLLAGVIFTPAQNYNSNFTITISVDDGIADAITGTKVITGTEVDDPAIIAGVDTGSLTEDLDPNADTLLETGGALSIVDPDIGESSFVAETITGAYGDLTIDAVGNWNYSADNTQSVIQNLAATDTLSDSISVTSFDGTTHNIVITIGGVNDAPTAVNDDIFSVNEGGTAIFNLVDLAENDSDIDNALDLNSIKITGSPPAYGNLVVNGDGTVSYTHDGSQTLTDSFSYIISDVSGLISNTATVNVTVNPINNAPTTIGIVDVTVTEDALPGSINLNAAFDDVDNLDSELIYSVTGNTSIGLFQSAAVNTVSGELVLDYAANMNGSSQISVRATDPSGAFVNTLFTVTITPVNDTPILQANTGMAVLETNTTVISNTELNVNDIDNINTEIVYTVTTLPTNGVLLVNGVAATVFTEDDIVNNRLSYQSDGSVANDQFEFTVSDSAGGTISANTFNIVVQLAPVEPEVNTTTVDPEPLPDPVVTTTVVDTEENIQSDASIEVASEREDWYVGSNRTQPPPQQIELTLEPVPQQLVQNDIDSYEKPAETSEAAKNNLSKATSVADLQVKSVKALWQAIDQIKQQIDRNVTEDMTQVEFRAAAVSSSGVALSAGVVAWVLRGGALMSSLISTIPLWKAYDPLPILAYRDDEEKKKNITVDKIPVSLKEMREIKALKEKMKIHNRVDGMFGGPGAME